MIYEHLPSIRRGPGRLLGALAAVAVLAATPAAAAQTTAPTHPLTRALELDDAAFAAMPLTDQARLADWLWVWQFQPDGAPVSGSTAEYVDAGERARTIYRRLMQARPDDPRGYWKLARANYDVGELLPETATDRRMALYEEMIEVTTRCVEDVDPKSGGCWHFLATGIGRQSTTRGVLASLFSAREVLDAWNTAYAIAPTTVALNGDPLMNGIRYGLGVFYRMVPDAWIVKLLGRVRGDIHKSVAYFREAIEAQPYRLELQKELAVALLCLADREDGDDAEVAAAGREGMDLLKKIQAGAFDAKDRRALDAIDKAHAADLEAHPERACGYSRDGYEDLSDEALDDAKAKHDQAP